MRQLAFFLLASGLFWTGCIGNDSLGSAASAQKNIENLARISLGMSDREVFQIMRHPYRSELFELDGDRYEVWFYMTRLTLMDQSEPVHTNLTPLIFKNGTLQGRGYPYYNKIMKQEAIAAEPNGEIPVKEDPDLEKALTPPPGSKPAQPSKQVPLPPEPPAKPKAKPKPAAKPKPQAPSTQNPPSSPSGQSAKPSAQPPQQSAPAAQPGKQPQATQPPAPVQPHPTQPGSSTSGQSNVSMSKSSAKGPPSEEVAPTEDNPTPPPPPKPEKPKSNVPLTEEDEKMLQEEQEENFDFW